MSSKEISSNLNLKQFTGDTLYTIFRQVWAIGFGLIISVLLARGLGPEGRGIYALAILLPTLLITFTNLGVPTATAYYIANREYDFQTALGQNIVLSVWISCLTLAVGVTLSLWAGTSLFPGVSLQLLFLALALVPFMLLNANLLALLHGIQDFKSYNFARVFPQLFTIVFLILLVWTFKFGVGGALIANGSSQIVTVLILLFFFKRKGVDSLQVQIIPDWKYAKRIFSFGSKSYLSNAIAFLNYRADMFLLNLFAGAGPVGTYAIAVGLTEQLWVISKSVSTVLFPKIASMEGGDQKRNQLTTLVARHTLGVTLLIGLALFLIAEILVKVLYGIEYQQSVIALRFLIPGVILTGMSRVLANDIAGRGKPEINTIHSAIALVLNIILNLIFISRMGAVGAALASSISYSSIAVMKIFAFSRVSGEKWYRALVFTKEDFAMWNKLFVNMKKKFHIS